jgi:alanine dehydrogenase
MGADVAVLDRNPEALPGVEAVLGNRVRTLFSTCDVVELLCPRAISSSRPFSCRAQPCRN